MSDWLSAIWTVFWKCGLFFVIWALGLALLIVPFSAHLTDNGNVYGVPVRVYFEVVALVTILAAAWIMVFLFDKRSFTSLGFNVKNSGHDIGLGLAIGMFWLLVSLLVLWLGGWAKPQISGSIGWSTLAIAALAMIMNTATQEVLARSYIFQVIQSQTNVWVALLLSSMLFVLYHAAALKGAWLPTINVFAASILFGLAYYYTGNLWLPIAIHFAWNFLLGPVLGLSISGQNLANNWRFFTLQGPALATGGAFGLEGSLIVTIATAACIVGLVVWNTRP